MKAKIFIILTIVVNSFSAQENPQGKEKGSRNSPSKVKFTQNHISRLKLPEGFSVNVFAKDLDNPRILALSPDGETVFVTEPKEDKVTALKDNDNNGEADKKWDAVKDVSDVHGIAVRDNKVYVCAPEKLYSADIKNDNTFTKPQIIFDNLPEGGRHENRTLKFSPDSVLHLSVGSSCNACVEKNQEHATILKVDLTNRKRSIFARGLRNTIGFAWHPETKELWGMDHGSDWRGDDLPYEELNKLEEGKDYGWPFCYGKNEIDLPMDKPEYQSKEDYCAKTTGSVLEYQAHSAPIEMVFYTGEMFPSEYRNDAFIAMRGSWNRKNPTGYKIVRLKFNNGKPEKFEDFLTGFLINEGKEQFARPAGLLVMKDGSLLLSDDDNGVIYRISYKK